MTTRKCNDCGEDYVPTPCKPGYVVQCAACGREAERVERVMASQAEDEDGVAWYVERRKIVPRTTNVMTQLAGYAKASGDGESKTLRMGRPAFRRIQL